MGRRSKHRLEARLNAPASLLTLHSNAYVNSYTMPHGTWGLNLQHGLQHGLCKWRMVGYGADMSTVQDIEAAIPKLSRAELEQLRVWFEDYLEDHLELTDETKAKLDESRREIAAGNFTTRQPK